MASKHKPLSKYTVCTENTAEVNGNDRAFSLTEVSGKQNCGPDDG